MVRTISKRSLRAARALLGLCCAAATAALPDEARAETEDRSAIPRFTLTSKLLGIQADARPQDEESYRLKILAVPRSAIEAHLERCDASQNIASVLTQWVYPRLRQFGHRVTREGLTVAEFDEETERDDARIVPNVSMNTLGARFRLRF